MKPKAGEEEEENRGLTAEQVGEIVTTQLREFAAQLKAPEVDYDRIVNAVAEKVKPDPGAKQKPSKKEDDPEFVAMRERMEEMERKTREAEEASRRSRLEGTIRDALIAGGADSARLAVALNHIKAEGKVIYNDDGQLVYVGKDKYGQTKHGTVADGVKEFLDTDVGKMFLPAKQVAGTGSGADSATGVQNGGEMSPSQVVGFGLGRLFEGEIG